MNSVLFPASLMLFSCFGCLMDIHYTFRVTIRQCVFGWQENSSLLGPSKLSLHFTGQNPMPFPRLSTGCVSYFSAAMTEYPTNSLEEKGPILAFSFRGISSVMMRKTWQQECETA